MSQDVLINLAHLTKQIYKRFSRKYLHHMLELHNIVLEIYNNKLELCNKIDGILEKQHS